MLLASSHPRNDLAVIEADDQLHLHRHFAAHAFDDADDVRILAARRHKIDQANGPALGFNFCFENERLSPVAATRSFNVLLRKKPPVSIFAVANQRRKASGRIEPGKTKPVDTAVTAHQRAGLRIAKKSVVLDLCMFLCHLTPTPTPTPT